MSYGYYEYYPKSTPRKAKGGIKAQSKRGSFGKSWWAKHWIGILEDFDMGGRLERGKSYARKGQVVSIDIQNGRVTAMVQGSMSRPYHVEIRVKTLSTLKWEKVCRALLARPIFAAKLLACQMPENIEDVFRDIKLSLFPDKVSDLSTGCSCPDWSNPCKHVAAVYFLLGEEFDRDPFLIFKLRGAERESLLGMMGLRSIVEMGTQNTKSKKVFFPPTQGRTIKEIPLDSASLEPEAFWGRSSKENIESETAQIPATSATLPKHLGSFPFWRSEENFICVMEDVYDNASSVGLDTFLGKLSNVNTQKKDIVIEVTKRATNKVKRDKMWYKTAN